MTAVYELLVHAVNVDLWINGKVKMPTLFRNINTVQRCTEHVDTTKCKYLRKMVRNKNCIHEK